jgi:hypothetical protein
MDESEWHEHEHEHDLAFDDLEFEREIDEKLEATKTNILAEISAERERRGGGKVCPIDLMILLDESGSIYNTCSIEAETSKCWDKTIKFLTDLVDELKVGTGPDDARIGLVKFSTCISRNEKDPASFKSDDPSYYQLKYPVSAAAQKERDEKCPVVFKLQDHTTRSSVKRAIRKMTHEMGGTQTRIGLEQVRKHLIPESFAIAAANKDRPNPHRLVLVLTDGGFNGAGKLNYYKKDGTLRWPDFALNDRIYGKDKYDPDVPKYAYPRHRYDPADVAKEIVTVQKNSNHGCWSQHERE